MLDFHEGWELYHRLIKDGYLSTDFSTDNGKRMEQKIRDLAMKYYDWQPKEPDNGPINLDEGYRRHLEQQTASERLNYIWSIAIDYDGYRTYRGVASLLDEIIDCTQVKTKGEEEIKENLETFSYFKNDIDRFMRFHFEEGHSPLYYAFPLSSYDNIVKWCEENDFDFEFITPHYDKNGETFAVSLKIFKKIEREDECVYGD